MVEKEEEEEEEVEKGTAACPKGRKRRRRRRESVEMPVQLSILSRALPALCSNAFPPFFDAMFEDKKFFATRIKKRAIKRVFGPNESK